MSLPTVYIVVGIMASVSYANAAFAYIYCNAAAASFVRHGSQEIPIFIIGCVVYLSMVQ